MKPYFDTNHVTAVLLLIVSMGWGMMEAVNTASNRDGATKIGGGGQRFAVIPALIAASAMLWLGPYADPGAAIRPGAAPFAAGLLILVAGLVLRGWAIKTLGDYFTGRVMVSADQPVITAGPYRLLRHPSYTGLLLACAGTGLAAANWISVAAMVVLPLAALLWRIHAEENALLSTLGSRYAAYAAQRKRLVPLIW